VKLATGAGDGNRNQSRHGKHANDAGIERGAQMAMYFADEAIVVEVEPAVEEFGEELSPEVSRVFGAVCELVESLAQDAQLGRATRETLGSVLEEVERLAEIVDSLFALSRLDAGEAPAEWLRFDLAELAATTAGQMSLLAEDKHVSVDCESSPGVTVEGDRARLKQVIVNLLDNAIKYTPRGGRVRLSVRREGGCAVLEVVDDGIGIPAEALPHVFKRFYRVDTSRSREQGGADPEHKRPPLDLQVLQRKRHLAAPVRAWIVVIEPKCP